MNTPARSVFALPVLLLLTSACLGDPAEPEIIIEPPPTPVEFEAVSANDQPLPAFINADGSTEAGKQLTEASLVLLHPDSLRLILSTRQVAENGEPEATVNDTLWARIQAGESTYVLSKLEEHPLLLSATTSSSDRTIVITVLQPLPPADGGVDTYPVELLFRLAH